MSKTKVLIAGAGPTGLTLALWLTKLGVPVRIFDKAAGPGETSRALAVQARTLEFHRQIGIVEDVLAEGVRLERLTVHTPAGVAARLPLSDFGRGISPYSFAFALPQDVHERVLITHLERAGVEVERNTELVAFEDEGDAVVATLSHEGRTETVSAAYLAGCDGARSTVRHGLNIGFPGGTYEQAFYVADVRGRGEITRNGMDTTISTYGFAIVMPVRQSGSVRLIGIVPKAHEADETISFEAIRADVERETGVTVDEINWFSTYRVHHRVAERFRVGRVFLVGDAGHIHSPAGGQGMNTGMGDAVNLAWKLAAVVQGRADPRLLDSYEPERIAFAKKLIESTDTAFRFITSRSRLIGLLRRYLIPKILNMLLHTSFGSRFFFGVISQAAIQYRAGPISSGTAGKVSGGDRLPYVAGANGDNFEPLRSLDWQIHVYGEVNADFRSMLAPTGIAVHAFAWSDTAEKAGLQHDAAYLVRPDGHVALASPVQEAASFQRYLAGLAIRPRTAERAPYRVLGTMHSLA
ncbi:FAD-dependent monooxygenase [Mesorhizobium sp. VK4C]|uniref:FAD-dependent monooxygenase n=1 Tax=Mesorhizobium captivum TaxID=3072319 RepID=UPI002A248E1D|nr:FAD-dependent monooxygenase [Mesorhizobium sp. VK4C]MDX8501537.1 FAD-dependent monooxygenase [Mesorhizobium sp. VK4C]